MGLFKQFLILFIFFTVIACAENTVLLPTVSRAPRATKFITSEFDRLMRKTADELQLKVVPADKTMAALDRHCISAEMPVYTTKRLCELAKTLETKRLYRIVVQKISVYSRRIRTAKNANGDTFYFGQLQGTLQIIDENGLVVEGRVFNVDFNSVNRLPPGPSRQWDAEAVAAAMVQEALAVLQPGRKQLRTRQM